MIKQTLLFLLIFFFCISCSQDFLSNMTKLSHPPAPGIPYLTLSSDQNNPGEILLEWNQDFNTDQYDLYRCFPQSENRGAWENIALLKNSSLQNNDRISVVNGKILYRDNPDYVKENLPDNSLGEEVLYKILLQSCAYPGKVFQSPSIPVLNYYPPGFGAVFLHVSPFAAGQKACLWWNYDKRLETVHIYRMRGGVNSPYQDISVNSDYELINTLNVKEREWQDLDEPPESDCEPGFYFYDNRCFYVDLPNAVNQLFYYKILLINSFGNRVFKTYPDPGKFTYAYVVDYYNNNLAGTDQEPNNLPESATLTNSGTFCGTLFYYQPRGNGMDPEIPPLKDQDWYYFRTAIDGKARIQSQNLISIYNNPSSHTALPEDLYDVVQVMDERGTTTSLNPSKIIELTDHDHDGIIKLGFLVNGYPGDLEPGDLSLFQYHFKDVTYE